MRRGIKKGSVTFTCLTEKNAVNTALKHGFANMSRNSVWKLYNCPTPIHIASTAYVERVGKDLVISGNQYTGCGIAGIEFNRVPIDRNFVNTLRGGTPLMIPSDPAGLYEKN